jgi:hypothetical protein
MRSFARSSISWLMIAMIAILLLTICVPGVTATKETDLLTWNGSAWARIAKGTLYSYTTPTAAATMAVGGGYGSSGCTIAATGNIQTNGTLTVDGVSVLTGATTITGACTQTGEWQAGGGYASTGVTVATTGNTSIAGTLIVDGIATIPVKPIVNLTDQTLTISATHYGKYVVAAFAGATTITLPDPGAGTVGAEFYIVQSVNQDLTIIGGSGANNNQIIADGVLTTDNVAYTTSNHKVGAMCRVFGISATKWLITNASACAMTIEAAD